MENIIDLNTFADGAVAEQFNRELRKVLENIADPNTDAKKSRRLTLTVTFKGDEQRDLATVHAQAKATLVPAKGVEAKIVMDYDSDGRVTGAELKSGIKGQTFITDEGEIAEDNGKVIDFKQTN